MAVSRTRIERALCAFVFVLFIMVTCYKLTEASLWYDEAVEFWYSRAMVGGLPFVDEGNTMYDRIIYTFQPPLYNFVMFFWLKLSDGEWWFRFFGVVMGFFSMVALYRSAKLIANGFIGLLLVVVCTFNYQLQYFWHECAEYCLALCALSWAVYYWLRLLKGESGRDMTLFTVFAVLSVYSQYGTVFPIVAMAVLAFLRVLSSKDMKRIGGMTLRYGAALLGAGLPLIFFFLRPQMLHQESAQLSEMTFENGVLSDMREAFLKELRVNVIQGFSANPDVVVAAMYVLLALTLIALVLGKDGSAKLLIAANLATWLLYYFSVKAGLYVHNYYNANPFGRRYSLFLIPMWMVLITGVGAEVWRVARAHRAVKPNDIKYSVAGALLCVTFCLAFMGWNTKLEAHWKKDNNREMVDAWYEAGAQDSNTFVYYCAKYGFAYYVEHDDQYTEHTEDNVHYMAWLRNASKDEYAEYIERLYGEDWPDEIYCAASHFGKDLTTITKCFKSAGYKSKTVYKGKNAKLLRFVKSE